MRRLILVRHGQSVWNLENIFTGWTDVELSPNGIKEAEMAGKALLSAGIGFDAAFVSYLKRAIDTLHIMAKSAKLEWVDEFKSWRLNERHYGALQGLNKSDTARKYGEDQVRIWRRSYDVAPPMLNPDDPRSPRFEPKYSGVPDSELPLGESLKMAIERVLPYWESDIKPRLKSGADVLVVAHGNSLRGLVKELEGISDSDIANLEIPTGRPLVFELDDKTLKPINKFYVNLD